jgi:hypothetical protein
MLQMKLAILDWVSAGMKIIENLGGDLRGHQGRV